MDVTHPMLTWYLAELDADEALVRAVEAEIGTCREGDPYEDGSGVASRDDYPSYPWGSPNVELEFMERWHPRAVLADIASKRMIAEIHSPLLDHDYAIVGQDGVVTGFADKPLRSWPVCSFCEDGRQRPIHYPCDTMRALVSAFAGRSGYDPSWGPT